MKLSSIRLNKVLKTTQFEARINEKAEQVRRYRTIEQSAERKEMLELEAIVTTPAFQNNKKDLLTRKYQSTEEYHISHRFNKANRSLPVIVYKMMKDSPRLEKMTWVTASPYVQDYLQLNDTVHDPEFIARNAFWANRKRWYTTPESKQDQRYNELKQSDDMRFFESTDVKTIEAYESCQVLLEDKIDYNSLSASKWKTGFARPQGLKTVHSYTNCLQAQAEGRNTFAGNHTLTLRTTSAAIEQAAWNEKKGFVMKHFDFAADVLQTASTFRMGTGAIMMKIRRNGQPNHLCTLQGDKQLPVVTLFQSKGKSVRVGLQDGKNDTMVDIRGVNPGEWFYYTFVRNNKELVWAVNGQEVLRLPNTLGDQTLYVQLQSVLPAVIDGKPCKGGEGAMDIAYMGAFDQPVRCLI